MILTGQNYRFLWAPFRALHPDLPLLRTSTWSGKFIVDKDNIPRSLLWKLFLLFNTYDTKKWAQVLSGGREDYSTFKKTFTENASESPSPPVSSTPSSSTSSLSNQTIDDPLSTPLHGAEKHLEDSDLQEIILKDVERTFPELDFFRLPSVQKSLYNILYIYAKLNPDISYKQGMHELAAPMIWVVFNDLQVLSPDDGGAYFSKEKQFYQPDTETLSSSSSLSLSIEADAFHLFSELMNHAKSWYMAPSDSSVSPPIVVKSQHIQNDIIKKTDPELYQCLNSNIIEPQIWALRWIRLLFAREFGFENSLYLWDCLFAATLPSYALPQSLLPSHNDYDNKEETNLIHIFDQYKAIPLNYLVDYVSAVVLLSIRNLLVDHQTTEILITVLNYPDGPHYEHGAMHTFVANGIYLLRQKCSLKAGTTIVSQYSSFTDSSSPSPSDGNSAFSNLGLGSTNFDQLVDRAKKTVPWDLDMDKFVRTTFNQVRTQVKTQAEKARAKSLKQSQQFVQNNVRVKALLQDLSSTAKNGLGIDSPKWDRQTEMTIGDNMFTIAQILANALQVLDTESNNKHSASTSSLNNNNDQELTKNAIEYVRFAKDLLVRQSIAITTGKQSSSSRGSSKHQSGIEYLDQNDTVKKYLTPLISTTANSSTTSFRTTSPIIPPEKEAHLNQASDLKSRNSIDTTNINQEEEKEAVSVNPSVDIESANTSQQDLHGSDTISNTNPTASTEDSESLETSEIKTVLVTKPPSSDITTTTTTVPSTEQSDSSTATSSTSSQTPSSKSSNSLLDNSLLKDSSPAPIRIRTRVRKNPKVTTSTSTSKHVEPNKTTFSHSGRPSLAQSEFSWILGGNDEQKVKEGSKTDNKDTTKSSKLDLFGL